MKARSIRRLLLAVVALAGCRFDLHRDLAPGELRGRVVKEDVSGHLLPVEGAAVTVDGARAATRTDASGAFVLRGLAPATYGLRVTHDADGDGRPDDGLHLRATLQDALDLGPLAIGAFARLEGRTVKDGAPAPGATVVLDHGQQVVSGADGSFAFDPILPGAHEVVAVLAGPSATLVSDPLAVTLAPRQKGGGALALVAPPTGTNLSGHAILAGVGSSDLVSVRLFAGTRLVEEWTTSKDGRWEGGEPVPPGIYRLEARRDEENYRPAALAALVVSGADLTAPDLVLFPDDRFCPAGDPACGRLTADEDGDGVPDAEDDCPAIPDLSQADADHDGVGDACAPTCTDGLQNGGETGVDCGGTCEPCRGRIEGVVTNENEDEAGVVRGAKVAAGGRATTADDHGRFVLEDVPAGRVLLAVTGPAPAPGYAGFSTAYQRIDVRHRQTSQASPKLVEGCRLFGILPEAGVTTVDDTSCGRPDGLVSVSFGPGDLVHGDGTPATRMWIDVFALPVYGSPPDTSWYAAFPADMTGRSAAPDPVTLESIGAAEVRLSDADTGEPLEVAAGHAIKLDLGTLPPPAGAPFTAWFFDPATGAWREDGSLAAGSGEDPRRFEITAPHLTWWNVDRPLSARSCVRGVVRQGTTTAAGAQVTATGADHGGVATTNAGADGSFCLDTKALAGVRLTATTTAAGAFLRGTATVTTGAAGASCATGPDDCLDVGTIAVARLETACARLKAFDNSTGTRVPMSRPFDWTSEVALTPADERTGRHARRRQGREVPGADGSVCLVLPPAKAYDLADSANPKCVLHVAAPTGSAPASCDDPSACLDLGEQDFFCGS